MIETKGVWRCNGCGKEIDSDCLLSPRDMEAFSWRDSTMSHWCRAGQVNKPCSMIGQIDDMELVNALSDEALERLRERLSQLLPQSKKTARVVIPPPQKRGPGKPKTPKGPPKVELEA